MEDDLRDLLCQTYRTYEQFCELQTAVLMRMNSLLIDTLSVRCAIYARGVTPSDTVRSIPANKLANRPRGNQYVATKVNVRPDEHDDLRFLPFNEQSGHVLQLENLDQFYSCTPFSEVRHSDQIILNRQLADFLMLQLLHSCPDFSIPQVARLLGKSPNLIQELRADVKLHYLHPITFSQTVVKELECKFCRICRKISCFVHFPSTTKVLLEDPFSGIKPKPEDKGKNILNKVDPKGWKNEWRKWQCSVWATGLWLFAHRCDDSALCSQGRRDFPKYEPGQVEKWIGKVLFLKGVNNPCLLAEFAEISCVQAAALFQQFSSQRITFPQRLDSFPTVTPTFPSGDSNQYVFDVQLAAEPSCCSCISCNPESCPCLDSRIESRKLCEKYCECSDSCCRRFLGCNCKYGRCSKATCVCVVNHRECDPDVCISCCAAIQIPKQYEAEILSTKKRQCWVLCINTSIQTMRHKRTAIAQSAIPVAGYGLFTLENLKKDEFITEYTGEMISDAESVRRGIIYDSQEHSYIFSLNSEQCIDAAVMGNKMRFANHRSGGEENSYARNMRIMGNTRVALYAKEDIPAGFELFFDYQYKKGEVKYRWFVNYIRELEERKRAKKKGKSVF